MILSQINLTPLIMLEAESGCFLLSLAETKEKLGHDQPRLRG
jgi:hypothetical protein